jgi:hypothetical protein
MIDKQKNKCRRNTNEDDNKHKDRDEIPRKMIDKQKDRWRGNTFEQDERYRRNVRGRGFHTRTGDIET